MERAGAVIACGDSWELKGGPVEGMAQYNDLGQRLVRSVPFTLHRFPVGRSMIEMSQIVSAEALHS